MKLRSVMVLAVVLAACSGGSDGSPTSPATTGGNNNNNGNASGNSAQNSASISIVATQSSDPYYGTTYGFGFTPTVVTVARGGTVSWVNTSGTAHNITFAGSGAPANLGEFNTGTKSATFNTAGTFSFACTLHPGMTGTVTVQ